MSLLRGAASSSPPRPSRARPLLPSSSPCAATLWRPLPARGPGAWLGSRGRAPHPRPRAEQPCLGPAGGSLVHSWGSGAGPPVQSPAEGGAGCVPGSEQCTIPLRVTIKPDPPHRWLSVSCLSAVGYHPGPRTSGPLFRGLCSGGYLHTLARTEGAGLLEPPPPPGAHSMRGSGGASGPPGTPGSGR